MICKNFVIIKVEIYSFDKGDIIEKGVKKNLYEAKNLLAEELEKELNSYIETIDEEIDLNYFKTNEERIEWLKKQSNIKIVIDEKQNDIKIEFTIDLDKKITWFKILDFYS